MKVFILAIAGLLGLAAPAQADKGPGVPVAPETDQGPGVIARVWHGEPILIPLRTDAERILHFPGATRVRPGLIGGPVPGLRIQPLDNRLYLSTSQPFERTRLLVQTGQGQVLLDLSAKTDADAGPRTMEILLPGAPAAAGTDTQAAPARFPAGANAPLTRGMPAPAAPVGYVALVRHAAQTLYAPERLMPREGRILRAPLHSHHAPHLMRGARIEAAPLAAWRAAGPRAPLWVTAVRLRNLSPDGLDLDPRDLRGQWRAAAFQHGRLAPAGREADVTTVYLVSDQAFDAALGVIAAAAVGERAR